MIMQCIFTFLAVCAFCILFEVPKKLILVGGIMGGLCWGIYLICLKYGMSLYGAAFTAAVSVALLSEILARLLKQPSPMFFVPGVLPIVPGYSLYYGVYNFAIGEHVLSKEYFTKAVMISMLIALSIFLVSSVFRLNLHGRTSRT